MALIFDLTEDPQQVRASLRFGRGLALLRSTLRRRTTAALSTSRLVRLAQPLLTSLPDQHIVSVVVR